MKLYSLNLPELIITSIVETTSELIFPFLDDIVSISTLTQRQILADDFRYIFENQIIMYRRNKHFEQNYVQSIRKAYCIKID